MRILVAVLSMSALAEAAPSLDVRVADDGTHLARQAVAPTSTTAFAVSRVIYLNRSGGPLKPGNNDSRTDSSSIIDHPITMAGWNTDATTWADTVSCMQEIWSPFGVEITEVDPGRMSVLFERFISKERNEPPDIDVDFEHQRR